MTTTDRTKDLLIRLGDRQARHRVAEPDRITAAAAKPTSRTRARRMTTGERFRTSHSSDD